MNVKWECENPTYFLWWRDLRIFNNRCELWSRDAEGVSEMFGGRGKGRERRGFL